MSLILKEKEDPLNPEDSFTDPRSYEIVKFFSELISPIPVKCWVAGGSILSKYIDQPINDIDLYFSKQSDFDGAKEYLLENADVISESEFSTKIQHDNYIFDLVKKLRKTPQQTIKGFDITVCCVAIDKEGTLYYIKNFFNDLNNKTLSLNKDVDLISSVESIFVRINKYGRKGFELNFEESKRFLKLMDKVREEGGSDLKKKSY